MKFFALTTLMIMVSAEDKTGTIQVKTDGTKVSSGGTSSGTAT